MKSICIKSNNKFIIDYLLKAFSEINLDSVYISTNSFKIYKNIILHYTGSTIDTFYNLVCDTLCNCILFFYERKIIKNILSYNYFYFSELEKSEILEHCVNTIEDDASLFNEKRNLVFNSLNEYLHEHHSIVMNGFVNFRLKDYKELLDYHVDIGVSNFLIEKEYNEFINLLHMYVNSKESNIDVLHLVYYNKEAILIDEFKNIIPISNSIFEAKYLCDISFSSNDYCLNSLLNLLPKKLYIHLLDKYEDEFINTLKSVFENRVSICTDCDICRVYKFTNNVLVKE